jgi:hypothetical protein
VLQSLSFTAETNNIVRLHSLGNRATTRRCEHCVDMHNYVFLINIDALATSFNGYVRCPGEEASAAWRQCPWRGKELIIL